MDQKKRDEEEELIGGRERPDRTGRKPALKGGRKAKRDKQFGYEDRIFRAALAVGDTGRSDAVPALLRLLSTDSRIRVKNGAAIALRELGANEAVPLLIELIESRQFSKQRGTFVYALQTLNWYSKYSHAVARLLMDLNYEVRTMALQALLEAAGSMSQDQKNTMLAALALRLAAIVDQPKLQVEGIMEAVEGALRLLVAKKSLRAAEMVLV